MQRAPSNASKQWDMLVKATKKSSAGPSNHVNAGTPGLARDTKQVVIDMRPAADHHVTMSAPLATQESIPTSRSDLTRGFPKPHFRWRGSPSSSTEDALTAPSGPNDSGIASLIYQARELSPIFTHPLANEVSSSTSPPPIASGDSPQRRQDLPQPYLSSITML
jgi:hypothetical protein